MYTGAIYGWYFHLTWLADVSAASAVIRSGIGRHDVGAPVARDRRGRLRRRVGERSTCRTSRPERAALAGRDRVSPGRGHHARRGSGAQRDGRCVASRSRRGLRRCRVAPAWPVCVELGGARAGVVSGTMNMCGNLGGTLCPIVVGSCVKRLSSWPDRPRDRRRHLQSSPGVAWIAVDLSRAETRG